MFHGTLPVCYTVAVLLFGWLGDRVRHKPLIVAGMTLLSLGTLATAGAENWASLLLCQSAVWVGSAIFEVLALSVLSDFYSERDRTWVFAVFLIMNPVGTALGDVMLEHLTSSAGWRSPLVFFAVPGLLFAALYERLDVNRSAARAISFSQIAGARPLPGCLQTPLF